MISKTKAGLKPGKDIYAWNDIGNRILRLGYLLYGLDASMPAGQWMLKSCDMPEGPLMAEIVDWQGALVQALDSARRQARVFNAFMRERTPACMPVDIKCRVLGVVAYRNAFVSQSRFFSVTDAARMSSLERTLEDVIRHRHVIQKLAQSGILVVVQKHWQQRVELHPGLGAFLLGDEPVIQIDPPAGGSGPDPVPADPPLPAKPVRSRSGPVSSRPTYKSGSARPTTEPAAPEPANAPLVDLVQSLPEMTPAEMACLIHQEGYIGQEHAVRSVCLMAWRHINRLKKLLVDHVPASELPSKSNLLLMGPTGCGKTHLVELLFTRIIKLPVVVTDATQFSECGYVGGDVMHIFTRLLQVAGDIDKASIGIVCLDEFDKLAIAGSSSLGPGDKHFKDLKQGVQQELLRLMEATDVQVPLELSLHSSTEKTVMNTRNIPFVCCGAFSGFWRDAAAVKRAGIGFHEVRRDMPAASNRDEYARAEKFEKFGIIPELFGRFSSVTVFDALGRDDLKLILQHNLLGQYQRELELNGIGLDVDAAVYDHIIGQCLERHTGARGLQSALAVHLENALFEAYSAPGIRCVRLRMASGQIVCDLPQASNVKLKKKEPRTTQSVPRTKKIKGQTP